MHTPAKSRAKCSLIWASPPSSLDTLSAGISLVRRRGACLTKSCISCLGETDALLGAKIAKAMSLGLQVVACCGEHKEEREAGKTMDVLIPQLEAIVGNTPDWSKLVHFMPGSM